MTPCVDEIRVRDRNTPVPAFSLHDRTDPTPGRLDAARLRNQK